MSEWYENLKTLELSDNIFASVKFYISGDVTEKALDLLKAGGAERMNYFSDFVTHLICGDEPEETDLTDANEVYEIPAVTQKWIHMCVKMRELLSTKPYIFNTCKLFSNFVFCFSGMGRDRLALWGIITYFGGDVQLNLDRNCTHLVTTTTITEKYLKANNLGAERIIIITPDWVLESVKNNQLMQADLYHPTLIAWPKVTKPESTTAITGFEPESSEIDDKILHISGSDSTEALLNKLKQSLPWNQHITASEDVPPPNRLTPEFAKCAIQHTQEYNQSNVQQQMFNQLVQKQVPVSFPNFLPSTSQAPRNVAHHAHQNTNRQQQQQQQQQQFTQNPQTISQPNRPIEQYQQRAIAQNRLLGQQGQISQLQRNHLNQLTHQQITNIFKNQQVTQAGQTEMMQVSQTSQMNQQTINQTSQLNQQTMSSQASQMNQQTLNQASQMNQVLNQMSQISQPSLTQSSQLPSQGSQITSQVLIQPSSQVNQQGLNHQASQINKHTLSQPCQINQQVLGQTSQINQQTTAQVSQISSQGLSQVSQTNQHVLSQMLPMNQQALGQQSPQGSHQQTPQMNQHVINQASSINHQALNQVPQLNQQVLAQVSQINQQQHAPQILQMGQQIRQGGQTLNSPNHLMPTSQHQQMGQGIQQSNQQLPRGNQQLGQVNQQLNKGGQNGQQLMQGVQQISSQGQQLEHNSQHHLNQLSQQQQQQLIQNNQLLQSQNNQQSRQQLSQMEESEQQQISVQNQQNVLQRQNLPQLIKTPSSQAQMNQLAQQQLLNRHILSQNQQMNQQQLLKSQQIVQNQQLIHGQQTSPNLIQQNQVQFGIQQQQGQLSQDQRSPLSVQQNQQNILNRQNQLNQQQQVQLGQQAQLNLQQVQLNQQMLQNQTVPQAQLQQLNQNQLVQQQLVQNQLDQQQLTANQVTTAQLNQQRQAAQNHLNQHLLQSQLAQAQLTQNQLSQQQIQSQLQNQGSLQVGQVVSNQQLQPNQLGRQLNQPQLHQNKINQQLVSNHLGQQISQNPIGQQLNQQQLNLQQNKLIQSQFNQQQIIGQGQGQPQGSQQQQFANSPLTQQQYNQQVQNFGQTSQQQQQQNFNQPSPQQSVGQFVQGQQVVTQHMKPQQLPNQQVLGPKITAQQLGNPQMGNQQQHVLINQQQVNQNQLQPNQLQGVQQFQQQGTQPAQVVHSNLGTQPQQQNVGPPHLWQQQQINVRHANIVQGQGPRIQWAQNQQQRQFIQLDSQTHQQLQQMRPEQRALFVAKLQKQRQLLLQSKMQQQQRGGHILIRGGPVPPGLNPQQQVQWLQQQAKQQSVVFQSNVQANITNTSQVNLPQSGPQPQQHAPGLSPIQQVTPFIQNEQGPTAQIQLQLQRQQQLRLQQLHLQREQAQKAGMSQSTTVVQPSSVVRPMVPPPVIDTSGPSAGIVDPGQGALVNSKTKTALANMLSIRLQSGGSNVTDGIAEPSAAGTLRLMTAQHNATLNPSSRPQDLLPLQQRRIVNRTGGDVIRPPAAPSVPPSPAGVEPVKLQYSPRNAIPMQHRPGTYYGHNPNLKLPPDLFLLGCVFVVVELERFLDESMPGWQKKIERHGGEIEKQYCSRVTHVICETQRHGVVMQALRDFKRCVTLYWLSDVINRKQVLPPWIALHLPTMYWDTPPAAKHLISLCGFTGIERDRVKHMIKYIGASLTTYFSKHNTLLIASKNEGQKYARAKKWGTPVVNIQWLTDMMLGHFTALNQIEHFKYQQFSDPPNFSFDPMLVPNLMHAWKMPINISQESYEKVKRSASPVIMPQKPKRIKTENTVDENENVEDNIQSSTHRILFSMCIKIDELKKIVRQLGGSMAKSHHDCTHLVMPQLIRSNKLLHCICLGVSIMPESWLKDSHTAGKFLDESNYSLDTKDFNNEFKCDFNQTLTMKNRNKLFEGKYFFITPSVFPGKKTLTELIQNCGGVVERIRRSATQIEATNVNSPYSYVILTHENDLHLVADLLKNKKDKMRVVCNVELILSAILKQTFEVEPYAVKVL